MNATRLTKPDDDSLPYRNLMCKVIEQACQWARGKDMSEYLNDCGVIGTAYQQRKCEETALAIEYLKSEQFEDDCGFLNISASAIRGKVLKPVKQKEVKQKPRSENRKAQIERIRIKLYNNIGGKKI